MLSRYFLLLFSCFFLSVQPLAARTAAQIQPWLGVEIDPKQAGALHVKRVLPDAPAARAGLKDGDIVQSVDGIAVKSRDELLKVLRDKGVGTQVKISLQRQGKTLAVSLKLEVLPEMLDLARKQLLGKPVPEWQTKSLTNGQAYSRKSLLGKVYILEFWATWCPACRTASPVLEAWTRANPKVPVIGLSDEEAGTVIGFAKAEKVTYPLGLDPQGAIQTSFGLGSIPAFVLVDAKGNVKDLTVGIGSYLDQFLRSAAAL